MRVAKCVLSLLFIAAAGSAADPVYLDELMEMPVARLQTTFRDLKKEGCYRIAENRYVLVQIDKKDLKPWRVVIATEAPCRRAETGPVMDLRERTGVDLGQTQVDVVKQMKRPETAQPTDSSLRRFGDMEWFYICRVSESCARHTSVFFKDGLVSAIAEWYSE